MKDDAARAHAWLIACSVVIIAILALMSWDMKHLMSADAEIMERQSEMVKILEQGAANRDKTLTKLLDNISQNQRLIVDVMQKQQEAQELAAARYATVADACLYERGQEKKRR